MATLEQYSISLRDIAGKILPGVVTLNHLESENEDHQLNLAWAGESLSAQAADYFEAFVVIRRALAERGLVPLCYGATRNVWPSGMSRSMGGGIQAYRMTLGKQALHKDLVNIFDTDPDVEPSTPEEQKTFVTEWFASLGHKI